MTQEPAKTHDFRSDILFAFALAAAAYVGWLVRGVLIILYVSALFAVVLTPVAQGTGRVHIRGKQPFQGPVAILVLVVILLGALTGFGFLTFPPVIHDLQAFGTSTPTQVPDLIEKLKSIPYVNRLNLNTSVVYSQLKDLAAQAATQVIVSVSELAGKIANIITCFVLTLYFMLEGDQAYHWCLHFVPPSRRQRLDAALQRAAVGMGKWLLGQASLMALLGLTSTIVFLLLDVRYAYALGVITGLLNIVPVLGVVISVVLALLVAALDSWGRVLGVAIFFAVYVQIENSYLVPRVMKSRVGLPSLAVFIALLLGFDLAGIPGCVVAVPTAVLVAVLLNEYLVWKDETGTA
jgi:predicted PurR-regulated permease PerM